MSVMREDWDVLQALFPLGWEQMGRSTGAVKRLRGFDSVGQLFRTLLMHVGCGWSLRETVVQAKLAGIAEVSDVALMARLQQAGTWLRQLCQLLWKENGVNLEPVVQQWPVRVIDATVVKEPGKTGSQWRIHYSMVLPSLECDFFELTPAEGPETGERLGRYHLRAGELVLVDAGYSNPPGVAAATEAGAYVCVRLNRSALPLTDDKERPFPLAARVASLKRPQQIGEWPVWVQCGGQRIAGRLCALRKSEEAIEKAQRKLERKQQKKGKAVTPQRRRFACYVMVFTTLPGRVKSDQVLDCYRLRWQVEITFKRLKSVAQLGHIPKSDEHSCRAWLYGKLFLALLSQKLARVGREISPWGYCLSADASGSKRLA